MTVSETIQANIRDSDFLIRQGGDEFIIIFDGIGKEEADKIWQRIVSKFDEINRMNHQSYRISVSHGMVEYKNNFIEDIDELIQLADDKMYKEKEKRKQTGSVLNTEV